MHPIGQKALCVVTTQSLTSASLVTQVQKDTGYCVLCKDILLYNVVYSNAICTPTVMYTDTFYHSAILYFCGTSQM